MELRRAGYAIVFAFMLCALVTVGLNWKKRAEMPFGNGPLEMNEETAELAWNFCRKEMPDGRDSFQDLYFCMPQEAIRMLKSTLWTRRNMQKVICDLSPELKQELFDCLTMKNPVFGISSQVASFSDHLRKTLRLVFDWSSSSPKRHQAYRSNLQIVYSISPSIAPSAIAVSPSYGPTPVSPSYGPTPSSYVTSDRLYSTHYHRQTNIQNYQADEAEITSGSSTIKRSEKEKEKEKDKDKDKDKKKKKKKKKKNKNQTVIAIVTTAVATFSFVSMMFLCLCCCRGSNNRMSPSDRRKDDAPLLHISLSASSSQNSASLENLGKTEYCGRAGAYRSNLPMNNANPNYPLAQVPLTGGGNPVVEASPHLKPPPGRVIPPPAPPAAAAPPPPPPPTARPPPPPKPPPPQGPRPPPAPPPKAKAPPPGPLGRGRNKSSEANDIDSETGAPKTKLKPFFWDKVVASPDHTMVWHEISDGSFQFNEEMIESLFGYTMVESNKNERKKEPTETSKRYIQIIDPRKAQNLSILLRALNVTIDEIVDALLEGNQIPVELLETLLKMAPTAEEELKLRLFSGDVSQLGPAERFLKVLIDIPSAFRRIEALIFMSNMQEEVVNLKQSFATFEVACNKIRNSRLFLKLLEAVLKTGNRMNDGTYRGGALAFKLDTLLKLSDVKGTDGKTTLLHFVVQEIIRSEGVRAVRTARSSSNVSSVKTEDFIQDSDQLSTEHYSNLGLQVVSGLFNELEDVRKAAVIDADGLASSLTKLKQSLLKNKAFLSNDLPPTEEENDQFRCALVSFLDRAESDISWLSEEEKRITALVKSTADYFHGNAGRDEGLRLFSIVRDFLVMLDKTCKEVKDARARKPARTLKANPPAASASSETSDKHSDMQSERLFPAIRGRRAGSSSSDDESPSP